MTYARKIPDAAGGPAPIGTPIGTPGCDMLRPAGTSAGTPAGMYTTPPAPERQAKKGRPKAP